MFNWFFNLIDNRTLGAKRSGGWSAFQKTHIKSLCEFCEKKGTILNPLQLHHSEPFNKFPEKELDPDNVVTGCRHCHLRFYHHGDFKFYNPDVKEDIKIWQEKRKNRLINASGALN